jgi:glutamyl-tRNA synthetase
MVHKFKTVPPIKVRFAPSPTGHLHIGGARTALFNYLFSKGNMQDQCILRIEDTDFERSRKEYEEAQIKDMEWLGIKFDGEVYRQSDRMTIYKKYALQLFEEGKVYLCTCSKERLEKIREEAKKENKNYHYDGKCRDTEVSWEEAMDKVYKHNAVLRFKNPNLTQNLNDKVKGSIWFPPDSTDDFIICRSLGQPTYHFCCVVDDHIMGITHVIRADDHLNNTAKHLALYKAFGWEPPVYAHAGLLVDEDGKKLSKRNDAVSVFDKIKEPSEYSLGYYRNKGYFPEVMVNYLCLLGWSHPFEQTIFSLEAIIKDNLFSLEGITKSPSFFDEKKLEWMNGEYLKKMPIKNIIHLSKEIPGGHWFCSQPVWWQQKFTKLFRERVNFIKDFFPIAQDIQYTTFKMTAGLKETLESQETKNIAQLLERDISGMVKDAKKYPSVEDYGYWVDYLKQELGIKGKSLFKPLRAVLTGSEEGPAMNEYVPLIPLRKILDRLTAV